MSELPRDATLYACLYQPAFALRASARQAPEASHSASARQAPRFPHSASADQAQGLSPIAHRPANDPRPTTHDHLVAIAAEFSPRYEQHRADLVSVDVRGLSRLFGTPKSIGGEMRREAASRGVLVHVAIAPTRMAALVMALARPGLTVVPAGGVAAALAPVPLSVLEQLHEEPQATGARGTQARLQADDARAAIAALKRWGLRTLGELAVLPAADLSARLGRGGRVWQAVARGEDTRPLVPMQAD